MTVGIIGLGYVGLTLAIAMADHGVTVYGTETNTNIKECLLNNHAHFFEPGLDELIEKHNNKSFFSVESFPGDVKFDAFIITVGTPLKKGEKLPNFEHIKSALKSLEHVYNGTQLIILRSTVSVGTTTNIVLPFLSELCGKDANELLVAMCPERTVEGKAVEELTGLPQIIGGNNDESLKIAEKLFSMITNRVIIVDSLEEAELVKLFNNVYRDTMFAVGNVFCVAAQQFGVDGTKIIQAANDGYPRSKICLPGFVAGPCLEKDAYILTNNMPDCTAKDFILSERRFNESLEDMVVQWVESHFAKLKNKTIALSGMAFKGVPETSDLRGSSSVYIAEKLNNKGYKLRLHDFVAKADEMKALNLGRVCGSIEEVCKGAEALLILNNHRAYAGMHLTEEMKAPGFVILDSWNVCDAIKTENNRKTLGNMMI